MDRSKLAIIHVIKKELRLSDEAYRSILMNAAGVSSAKELTEEKFRKLMRYFVRSSYYKVNPYGLTIKQKLYIRYLAHSMGWDDDHLNNFIHKYYHKSHVDQLTRAEGIKLIESLKHVKSRQNSSH